MSFEDESEYYADDFDLSSPATSPTVAHRQRPGTAPKSSLSHSATAEAQRGALRELRSISKPPRSGTAPSGVPRIHLSTLKRSKSSPGGRHMRNSNKSRSGRNQHLKTRPEWVGSPSTFRELTYSSTSNRTIVNLQSIPSKPPRIPGTDAGILSSEKIMTLVRNQDVAEGDSTVSPALIDTGGSSADELSSVSHATSIPSKVSDVLAQAELSTGLEPSNGGLGKSAQGVVSLQERRAADIAASHGSGRKWIGSPSSTLPFTFSRTANRHFRNEQMWPAYDASKDAGCSFTHTPQFRKWSRKQLRNQEREISEVVDKRHRIMRIKQRGALAAAVAMTEAELPKEVDDVVAGTFDGITEKIFASWRDRRGLMMSFPQVIMGLDSSKKRGLHGELGGYILEKDLNSAMQCVGLELSEEEFAMFCRLLYPKNRAGHYSCTKAIELVMAGHALLGSAGDAAAAAVAGPSGLVLSV